MKKLSISSNGPCFLLLISLIFPALHMAGQPMIPRKSDLKRTLQFKDLELAHFEWMKSATIEDRNRWKYYSRWIEESARHTDPSGEIANQSILFREAIKISNKKKNQAHQKIRQSGWIPLGPAEMPSVTEDFMITGKGRINTMAFHPTEANTMFVGTSQGGVWKTTNNGESWFPISDNLPILRISDIAINPQDPEEMYISVGDMAYVGISLELDDRKRNTHYGLGIYKTTDGGESWEPTGLTFSQLKKDFSISRRVLIDRENPQNLVVAGFHGIWVSDDAGTSWNQTSQSMIWDIEQDPVASNILYASTAYLVTLGGDEAGIIKSSDFGLSWREVNIEIPQVPSIQRLELTVSKKDPNILYAVACNLNSGLYGVFRSENAGDDWVLQSSSPNILHWYTGEDADNGQGTYDLTIISDPEDVDKVYVGGVNVWMSDDGGVNWDAVSYYRNDHGESIHADQHFFAASPHTYDIYICNDGGVFRTQKVKPGSWSQALSDMDYKWPTKWEQITGTVANTSFYRLSTSNFNPEHVFAGAQDLGTFYNQSGSWEYNLFGDGMECIIHPESDQIIYGSLQYGNIQKSTNGGKSFQNISSDFPIWDSEYPAWTTPYMLDPLNPEKIVVPMSNVWYSENGGDDWDALPSIPNGYPSSAMAISHSNPRVYYVAKRLWHSQNQPSEVYRIAENGFQWFKRDQGLPDSLYITYLEIDPEDKNRLWTTYAGFGESQKVYITENGGLSWKNISKNLPNIPVNCIVYHSGMLDFPLYVGTDIGIYYTNDEMDTWELYSDDLPNVIVTELEINDTHQKIYASTFGRGIWSNDLVDQFQTSIGRIVLDQLDVGIYPNPVASGSKLNIKMANTAGRNLKLEIVNVLGKIVHSEWIVPYDNNFNGFIPANFSEGLYYLVIHMENSRVSKKFIVD